MWSIELLALYYQHSWNVWSWSRIPQLWVRTRFKIELPSSVLKSNIYRELLYCWKIWINCDHAWQFVTLSRFCLTLLYHINFLAIADCLCAESHWLTDSAFQEKNTSSLILILLVLHWRQCHTDPNRWYHSYPPDARNLPPILPLMISWRAKLDWLLCRMKLDLMDSKWQQKRV